MLLHRHVVASLASRLAKTVSLSVAALLLSGCVPSQMQSGEVTLSSLGGQQRWAASDMVAVGLSDADRERADEHYTFNNIKVQQLIVTGPMWANMFVGDWRTDPIFRIESAVIKDEAIGALFAVRHHYIVDGVLVFEGKNYRIHAEGARATGTLGGAAMHEAIQLGVVDAAQKVRFIVSGGLKTPGAPGRPEVAPGTNPHVPPLPPQSR